jgi:hypothetical protein
MPQVRHPQGNSLQLIIVWETGWALELVWMLWSREKSFSVKLVRKSKYIKCKEVE